MNNKIRKSVAFIAAAAAATSLAACAPSDDGDTPYKVYMPDGAPAIALASFMANGYDGAEFTVVKADTIAARAKTADLAILPVNAAATLYNSGVDIVMLTVNTHGNLYIVGSGDEIGLDDLAGKRLGVIGMGLVPDMTLRMLLAEQNITLEVSDNVIDGSVSVHYESEGGKLLPRFATGDMDYALLAEPAVTTAMNNLNKIIVADVQELWQSTFGGEYPQACLVASGELVRSEEGKEFIDKFIADLAAADGWAEQHPAEAVAAIAANMESGTDPSLIVLTAEIINRCNIKTVTAAQSKATCESYFERLTLLKTELGTPVLAKVPDEGFYYKG